MATLQALIFDVDGTLADTERFGHRVAFNRAFSEWELDWHWSITLYGKLLNVSGGKERIRHYLEHYQPDFVPSSDLEQWIHDLHQTKITHYQALLNQDTIPLRPGVQRVLTEARSHGIRLAISTTSVLPNVLTLLEKNLASDAPQWFEAIAAGDMVKAKKPAPDIYHYVLAQLNLAPESCLVFEDTEHGLQAATQAGLETIVTVNDYTQGQNFARARLVIDHLGEPDYPFHVLAGDVGATSYLTLEVLKQLHHQQCYPPVAVDMARTV